MHQNLRAQPLSDTKLNGSSTASSLSNYTDIVAFVSEHVVPEVQAFTMQAVRWRSVIHHSSPQDLSSIIDSVKDGAEKITGQLDHINSRWVDHGGGHSSNPYFCSVAVKLGHHAETLVSIVQQYVSGENIQSRMAGEGVHLSDHQRSLLTHQLDEFTTLAHEWTSLKRKEAQRVLDSERDPFDALLR